MYNLYRYRRTIIVSHIAVVQARMFVFNTFVPAATRRLPDPTNITIVITEGDAP